ncbi:MAG: copper amine oxidase N-terminal domain-containing protein [Syntrophomonadaceae bacterium]|jgi:hypothetical protein|nr:copper amine oxidase N-terminal domain-containing protein [Syntrophomonadaceae bacterium]
MKKAILFMLVSAVSMLSANVISVSALEQTRVEKSQLKQFAGKTAVVTTNIQLSQPYTLTYSDGAAYTDVLQPLVSGYSLKKGDIVIVMEESGSSYRVTIPATGDAEIISGFLEKRYVSYDKTLILNANQCGFKNVVGYNSTTNAASRISGNSVIYDRSNGRLLVTLPGGDPTQYWINAKDASFNYDRTVTDISLTAYNELMDNNNTPLTTVELKVTMNKLQYTVNGSPAMFDVAPYLDTKANRSMIPMRFIAEAFGAKVVWDDATKTQIITLNGKTFKLTQNAALPDGMGTPVLVKDRFFVPLRYVSQELGARVDWDNATQTNTIIYEK